MLHFISSSVFGDTFEQARPKFHYSVGDRAAGYVSVMREAGLVPAILHHDRYTDDADQMNACRALLQRDDRPTAVLVYSERDVSSLMCAAGELGLQIPRDLSVLVFHPGELWVAGKYVSAVEMPTTEIGERAVAMLMRKIESPNELWRRRGGGLWR